ncbi:hypothetical protein [Xanthocytophaga agilis]|uniref:Lipoprotein n=1 Tax=Xanthocytophaga agilis TaxID=3048010 RepID=A0AAE3UDF1_9BACT|nr:hypothetical protein [Xanthocytophaga agilis]MDJ1501165.1 hypothetical protein [Xanthocytophaga agilis]
MKINTKRLVWILNLFLGVLTVACQNKVHSREELQGYITTPENGLIQSKLVQNINVQVNYHPQELLVAQELAGHTPSDSLLAQLTKKYADYYYFTVNLSHDNKEVLHQVGDMGSYSDLLQVLAFRMGEYTELVSANKDTVALANYMFDRTYGMATANTLLLAFPKKDLQNTEWVQVNMKEYGLGVGNLPFRFLLKDIQDVPTLDIKNINL